MVDFKQARQFIYANGILWERALFAYLFDGASVERVHQCLRVYQNIDGGYGHALEHDIRYPNSHPLAIEYLLRVLQDTKLPIVDLLDEAASWVESVQDENGKLINPTDLHDYPYAPWWSEDGQNEPDSIVGNLIAFGKANDNIIKKTRQWVQNNRTLEHIQAEEWLFLLYHAYDYFMNDDDFPDVESYREATIARILELIKAAPKEQYDTIFIFAPTPDSIIAQSIPEIIQEALDVIESQQQEDGSWHDQHNLPQWYPKVTINNLLTLQRYGRLKL
jgi:hypothetical protein